MLQPSSITRANWQLEFICHIQLQCSWNMHPILIHVPVCSCPSVCMYMRRAVPGAYHRTCLRPCCSASPTLTPTPPAHPHAPTGANPSNLKMGQILRSLITMSNASNSHSNLLNTLYPHSLCTPSDPQSTVLAKKSHFSDALSSQHTLYTVEATAP